MRLIRLAVVSVALFLCVAPASADPISWQASGALSYVVDHGLYGSGPLLAGLAVGTPWTLDVSYESTTPGWRVGCGAPTSSPFGYFDAVLTAHLQLGTFAYTNAGGGDIFMNWNLPIGSCPTPIGLVQYQWLRGWVGGEGGPDINAGMGLMIFQYLDANAIDGSGLPTSIPSTTGGLSWYGLLDAPEQFGGGAKLQATPEPASLLLLGTGVLGLIAVYRRRR